MGGRIRSSAHYSLEKSEVSEIGCLKTENRVLPVVNGIQDEYPLHDANEPEIRVERIT